MSLTTKPSIILPKQGIGPSEQPLAPLHVLDGMFDISTLKKPDIPRLQMMLAEGIKELKKLHAHYPKYMEVYNNLEEIGDGDTKTT